MSTWQGNVLRGTRAAQPAATAVVVGATYFVTDEGVTERSTGAAWESYSPTTVGGDVVGPASSTDNAVARWDGTTGKLLQNTSALTLSDTGVFTFPDNLRQTFNPGADQAGINVGSIAGDPGTPTNGDVWYDSTANELTARINGANVALGSGSGGNSTETTAFGSETLTTAGDLDLYTNSFYLSRYTGSVWAPWGPIFKCTPPVDGDFSWDNQGGASVSTTNGGIYLTGPASAATNLRVRFKTAPATPYTVTIGFLPAMLSVATQRAGVCFRQSSDGKIVTLCIDTITTTTRLSVDNWTSSTAFSANVVNPAKFVQTGLVWLRIADDGVNRLCSYSADGQNFIQVSSVARTTFLTADQVGFFVSDHSSTYAVGMTLLSWLQA